MSSTRAFRVAATGARLVTGAVIAVAAVLAAVAAVHAPWPSIQHHPAAVKVTPLPGDTVMVCNGDLRALGRNPADPLAEQSAATPNLTVAGSSGRPATGTLRTPKLAHAGELRTLTGTVEGRAAPLVGAAESATIAAADLAGFAALPCGVPRLESWLVGGSVATGTEDLVILTNAAKVNTTVTLAVYGTVRSVRTVVVPAETQISVPLTSIAAESQLPVVKVNAVGGPVRAVLQSSMTQTLDPSGIDLQDAVAGPQQHSVLAGVQYFASDGDANEQTVLRMLAPGRDAQARVTVRAMGDGAVANEFTVPLKADQPTEVSLDKLDPGTTYSVEIDADVPVLAAARQQDGIGPGSDFAWVTPATEIDADVLFAVPAGPSPALQVVNNSASDAQVAVERVDGGTPVEVTVPAGGSVTLGVQAQTVYRLGTTGTIHAGVTMTGPGALAAWPIQPSAAAQGSITVYP